MSQRSCVRISPKPEFLQASSSVFTRRVTMLGKTKDGTVFFYRSYFLIIVQGEIKLVVVVVVGAI